MKIKLASLLFIIPLFVLISFVFKAMPKVYGATSPGLGNAASFAVLAGTAITNVPTSVITGDVGLSPDAGSNYAGLTNAEVSGTIFAVDATGPAGSAGNNPTLVNQAKLDLVTAYNGLASGANADANCTPGYTFGSGNVDLVGLSLPPGVYCADTFTLTGTLTLTGSGVWVFRSGATLITSGTANVVGGDPCNVWWQVPSSATLGTNTSLTGSILALASITLNTNASLNGRALARNGAVTLAGNTINQSCTAIQAKALAPTSAPSTISSSTGDVCIASPITTVPIILDTRRIDSDSIFISWGPDAGLNQFSVAYGFTDGKWLYSTNVTGFSTTINDLPANQPIWVRVAARNDCAVGPYGASRLVGGASLSFPSTGSPDLPNAGVGPDNRSIFWYISAGLSALSSFLHGAISN